MYSKYLQCRTLICRRKNVLYSTITETFPSQYKRSVRKWEFLKLQRSNFHTTQRLHYPNYVTLCLCSSLCGLYIRKWWLRQTPIQQEKLINWYRKRRHILNGTLGFMSLILFIYCLTYFKRDPIVKKSRLILLSQTQISEKAREVFNLLTQNKDNVVPLSDPRYARVGRILKKVLNSNPETFQNYHWRFAIIYHMFDIITSPLMLSLPDNNIIFFSDFFNCITSDDQLAFILAREMAREILLHVLEGLSWRRMCNIANLLTIFLFCLLYEKKRAAILCLGTFILSHSMLAWYNRRSQIEADEVGLQLAIKSCIDPREVLVFLDILQTFEESREGKNFRDPIFSLHPSVEKRKRKMTEMMPAALELRRKAKCPELRVQDPRDYLLYYRNNIKKYKTKNFRNATIN